METTRLCPNGHKLAPEQTTCSLCGTISLGDELVPPRPARLPDIAGYKVIEELGQGGMGVVYKAWQHELQRWVALKMIRTKEFAGTAEVARFQAEARAIAKLHDSNIVQVYDVGDCQGSPYFSLEFVDGGTLESHLRGRPLPPVEAAKMIAKLARAMGVAHREGVVHRDLKPANVLLTRTGEPKIGDFGLVKRLDAPQGLSETGLVMGTPSYMSPEQARGQNKSIGPATDVFALGAIAYQMLTGRVPFLGQDVYDTINQVINQEPVAPRRLQPKIPADLETICLKCLSKPIERRYRDAGELAEDVERFLNGHPIHARPVGRIEKTWLWCRRNQLVASLMALSLVIFVVGFGLVTWKWQDAIAAQAEQAVALDAAEKSKKTADLHAIAAELAREHEATERGKAEKARRDLERTSYSQRLQLARREWMVGNTLAGDELLEHCPPEVRGWEWEFQRRLATASQIMVRRNVADEPCCAYHPKEKIIAVSGNRGSLMLIDAATGQFLRRLKGHLETVVDLAFSEDGKTLASAARDGRVITWDVATGDQRNVIEVQGDRKETLNSVVLSRDGRWIGYGNHTAYYLQPIDGGPKHAFLCERTYMANLAFSPDSQLLATGTGDGAVELRDARTHELRRKIAVGDRQVRRVAFSPDGKTLACADITGVVRLYTVETGAWIRTHRTESMPFGLDFNPVDGSLAAAGVDGVVRIWNVATGIEQMELRGSLRMIKSMAFAPDGRSLVTAGADDFVRVWSLDHRQEVWATSDWNSATSKWSFVPAESSVVMPNNRDRTIVSVRWSDRDGRLNSGSTGFHFANTKIRAIRTMAVHPSGKALAFSEDNAKALDDPSPIAWMPAQDESGRSKGILLNGHRGGITSLAFHPTRWLLASSARDGTVKLWDLKRKPPLLETIPCDKMVNVVQFSPDGKWLVMGGKERVLKRWDVDARSWLPTDMPPSDQEIRSLAISPDGSRIAFSTGVGLGYGRLGICDLQSKKTTYLRGHAIGVGTLAFHPWQPRLASADDNGNIKIWDTDNLDELLSWRAHSLLVDNIAFSSDGRFLISSASDGKLVYWNGEPTRQLRTIRGDSTGSTTTTAGVAFTPDGKRIVYCHGNSLRAWDSAHNKELSHGSWPILNADPRSTDAVAVSPDGQWIAIACSKPSLRSRNGDLVRNLPGHTKDCRWVTFRPDSRRLATCGNDGAILIWDVTGDTPPRRLFANDAHLNTVAYSPDGKRLASCGNDHTVRVWDPDGGNRLAALDAGGAHVVDVAFNSDGNLLAACDADGKVYLWDGRDYSKIDEFQAHPTVIQSIAFHPRLANVFVTVSDDGTIRLWRYVDQWPREIATLRGHTGGVVNLAFNPQGTVIATTGQDGTVRTWDVTGLCE